MWLGVLILVSTTVLMAVSDGNTVPKPTPDPEPAEGFNIWFDYVGDLNKDGHIDLIAYMGWGGTSYRASGSMILTLVDNGKRSGLLDITPTPFDELYDRPWRVIETQDLNNDGVMEVMVLDPRLHCLMGVSGVDHPNSWWVYRWENRAYREASEEFPHYYNQLIQEEIQAMREDLKEGYMRGGAFIRRIGSICLHLINSGAKRPWKKFGRIWQNTPIIKKLGNRYEICPKQVEQAVNRML